MVRNGNVACQPAMTRMPLSLRLVDPRRAGFGPHSLRTRMMLLVLLSFVPAIALSGGFVLVISSRFAVLRETRKAELLVDLGAGLDRWLSVATEFATATAARAGAIPPAAALEEMARANVLANAIGLRLALRDAAGIAVTGDAPPSGRALPAETLQALRAAAVPLLTDALPGGSGGPGMAHLLAPTARGDIVDVALRPAQLRALVTLEHLLAPARTMMIDTAGRVVASSDPALIGRLLPAALAARLAQPVGRLQAVWPDDARYSVAFAHLHQAPGWTVSLWDPQPMASAGWWEPVLAWAGFLALALTVAMLAAGAQAGRLLRPLDALTRNARATALGGDSTALAVPASSVREFEALRIGLAHAAAALRRRAATERQAVRAARDGQELTASVIAAVADGITVVGTDGRIVLANAAAHATLGVAPAGPTTLDEEVLASAQTRSCEVVLGGEAGAPRLVWMVKSPWHAGDGRVRGVVTVMRDVTADRSDQARLHALRADQADAALLPAIGVMAAGLAHDLNQPLAAAVNFLAAALHLLDRIADSRARDAVERASAQVHRAAEMVRELRGFLAEGRLQTQEIAVGDLLADACAVARADGSLREARLEVARVPAGLSVRVDARQLRQVLLNLLRNAAEALRETPRVDGLIRVLAHGALGGQVVIAVSDNGPGIPPALSDRLFEPFVSTKRGGLGFGLAICRTIVEAHGGELRLGAPAEGLGGATFELVLPAGGHTPA